MRAALAIAAAEIRQHRLVFWAGPIVGLLPLLAHYALERTPLRPVAHGKARPDFFTGSTGEFFVWAAAWVLPLAVALGLGATVMSRDLGERRLGFWLSRPVPLIQYWAGKIGAAFLLAVVAGALVLLPAHLLGSASWDSTSDSLFRRSGQLLRSWLTILALMVGAASVIGGAFRARGGLLILDFLMLPVVWAAIPLAMGTAWQAGTLEIVMLAGIPWFLSAAGLVLLVAGAVQVCVGRLELQRGHVLLSAITWGGLLVFFIGGIVGFSGYVGSSTPEELSLPHRVALHAPATGSHALLWGTSSRWKGQFEAGYLVDGQGRFVRIGGLEGVEGIAWSRDGSTFAWSREGLGPQERTSPFPEGFGFEPSVSVRRLGQPGPALRLTLARNASVVAVSPAGVGLLTQSRSVKQVVDIRTGQSIATLEDPLRWKRPAFLSEATVRALRLSRGFAPASPRGDLINEIGQTLSQALGSDPGGGASQTSRMIEKATVLDWDLSSGRATERGTITLTPGSNNWVAWIVPTEDWQRLLRVDGAGLFLYDLEGQLVTTFVDGWPTRMNHSAGPLSGGRYGCVEENPEGLRLRVFGSDGKTLLDTRLAGRFPLRVGGESAPGMLALGVAPQREEGQAATLFVDLATGGVRRREPGLSPALRLWEFGREPEETLVPEPGSLATQLFLGDEGLVSLNPVTNTRRVLVARHSRIEEN